MASIGPITAVAPARLFKGRGRLLSQRRVATVQRRDLWSVSASAEASGEIATGTPSFQTLLQGDGYSLRLYDTHVVVKTAYTRRDEGFGQLGSYLDGANAADARIPAPQPVFMSYFPDGSKEMQLFVPKPSDGLPPLPKTKGLRLEVVGGQTMGVVEFYGYATKEAAAAAKQQLIESLGKDGLQVVDEDGFFMIAQYGPLFSLTTRVNELLMPVKL